MKKHINLCKRGLATGVMAAGLLLVSGVSQAMPVVVSNGLNDGEGSVQTVFVGVTAEDNGGKGFVFEEADAGNINALVSMSETDGNDDGDVGIEVVQEDAGSGRLVLRDTTVNESEEGEAFPVTGIEADGVTVSEE